MERFQVEIKSKTPLLMHHNNLEARDEIAARGRKGGKPGDDRYPADTWKASLYVDETHIVMPAENLLGALLKAGAGIGIGKMKTLKAASQSIFFTDFYIPLKVSGKTISRKDVMEIGGDFKEQQEAALKLGFSLFVKPVNVNNKSHVRVRPRFENWSLTATFETDNTDLLAGTDRIESIWEGAGKCGVGDWRPNSPRKPGMYGVFTTSVKRL